MFIAFICSTGGYVFLWDRPVGKTGSNETQSERLWRGLSWLKMRIVLGSFEYGNKPFGSTNVKKD